MPLARSKLGNSLVIQRRASHLLHSHSYLHSAEELHLSTNTTAITAQSLADKVLLSFWRFSPSFVTERIQILTAVLPTIFSPQNFQSVPRREGRTWNLSVEIQCWISCHITANTPQLRSAKQTKERGRMGSRIFLLNTHPEAASQPTKLHLCNPLISLHTALKI